MKSINEQPKDSSIYIWNIAGSIANALISVALLMLVTRALNEQQADIFSISWSISQLMATIGTYQIRVYQATDVQGTFSFREYLAFRIITICVMMFCSGVYVLERGYDGYKAIVVLIVCLFRAVDSLADVYEGWFQQKERLDLAGKALTYRVVFSSIAFGVVLLFTKELVFSCLILMFGYFVCFLIYDVRYIRTVSIMKINEKRRKAKKWFRGLIKEGTPLFINSFIVMSIMNEPKMVIDKAIELGNLTQGLQTVFNILLMPASFLTLAYIVFRPMITKMAILWGNGDAKGFLVILAKILGCLLGLGILLLIGSALLGIQILSLIYAIDLSKYRIHLLIIIVGGCFYTFAAVLDNSLVVIRKQYVLLIAYVITYIYIKAVTKQLVMCGGIMGGAISYATAMGVLLIVTSVMFGVLLKRETKKKREYCSSSKMN